ncbi:bifunctional molybdopterin-guanine dinucleotide biosynthesis adaptor protein MobB/molybdopterin molybdotransferase MoeA [Vibrio sp. SS-MA-C1-2]|uniref:bifunctional molybdopterin-guanine dinucleotide biosynthesis adaptor protein MobB/molybdopterin molybdotransferase MoeA n=1 Tax=Vibrio sp. SS-MA-C1-2 TaxID=2908646 RepID=UPI001F2E9334|nr:bifunctional molybdopterin-guanine dinucleotide biosynthesis adaptor protein MobB/molybdopterin molybdotransferase MoeA [Vibrio sp. SS-MA-C1-2]UJF18157.1 bifunctional molybdopterin-guanine dinucleotide biosynthesis adaptor protein MobB/molybdopterin molybdotransferase MoeA [Vibrio sp. SS-MA-C1-2]
MISQTPIVGFAAYSGTGKTTLLEQLIPVLRNKNLKLAVIKHAHHDFDIDQDGKDSYRLRKAGADQMLISSRYRNALISETPDTEADLNSLLGQLDHQDLDLVLIEGFKKLNFPKIELHRDVIGKPWIYPDDKNIIAIATELATQTTLDTSSNSKKLPLIDINDVDAIADFITHNVISAPVEPSDQTNVDPFTAGFLSVDEGLSKILAEITLPETATEVDLISSIGQVSAKNILSPINVPQHNNSAMDGYAIRNEDIDLPSFTVVAEVLAGHSYDGELNEGEAVQIMTGAPVPKGAGTVIMREQSEKIDNQVNFSAAKGKIKAGQNVRLAGEDLAINEVAVARNSKISSAEAGLIASLGINQVAIFAPIKVAIFSTGDEVQAPGTPLEKNCIFDSNRYTVTGMLNRLGCQVIDFGIIEDTEKSLIDTLQQASEQADLVISSGGVSVGNADYIKSALNQLGSIDFWRINMRPGRPLAFGKLGSTDKTPFFGLPGNPVAVMVTMLQFVEPAIRKLQGLNNWQPETFLAKAGEFIRSRPGRTEYSRGIYFINGNGQLEVKTTGQQGSGILRSMSEANCLIEVKPEQANADVGDFVTIIPLEGRI